MLIRSLLGMCLLLTAGCRGERLEWVRPVAECPGGKVNTERKIVDTLPGGRVRSTTMRADACLE